MTQTAIHFTAIQSFLSIQQWQGRWRKLMLAIRGELSLQWIKNDPTTAAHRISFWGFFLGSLGFHWSDQNSDTQPAVKKPQIANVVLLPSTMETDLPKVSSRKSKSATQKSSSPAKHRAKKTPTAVPVAIHMLGPFSMMIGELEVKVPASRGLSVLKYLLLHHKQSTPREVLMDIFWPEAEPEMARNNLNVALHSLRKAVRDVTLLPVIRFEDGSYSFEPNMQVWLDIEEFERCVKAGQRLEERNQLPAAINEYEAAVSLYQGDFLEQNPYEEWTVLDRERLRIAYLDTLDRLSQIYFEEERYSACRSACQLILMRDPCREDAHCHLMRCYSRQGQHHLALRQYQMCAEALRGELQVEPAPETTQLYNRIRHREQV
jgi:DNA-binding SARP family transcriptional activator